MKKIELYENENNRIPEETVEENECLLDLINASSRIKEELGLINQPLEICADKSVRVNSIIGNISINDTNIVIYPKLYANNKNNNNELLKTLYKRTLLCAEGKLNKTLFFTKETIVDEEKTFINTIASIFADELNQATKKIDITKYETYENKLSNIKGKIDVKKEMQHPKTDEKIWCKYKKNTKNNTFNQLFSWACDFFLSCVTDTKIYKNIEQLKKIYYYDYNELNKKQIISLTLPKQFSFYKQSWTIAKNLFLGQNSKKAKVGKNRINGYVINMEKSFENMVCYYSKQAAKELKLAHKSQSQSILAECSDNGTLSYSVIPDDVVYTSTSRMIIDAKYKKMFDGVKPNRDDFYQMIASCIAKKATEAILVYPEMHQKYQSSWKVLEKINNANIIIYAKTIDILTTESNLVKTFEEIIEQTLFYKGLQNE